MAYRWLLLLLAIARRESAFAWDVLGIRRNMRAERVDQGLNRACISGGRHRALSPADRKSATHLEVAARLQHYYLSGSCCAVAYLGGNSESSTRTGARIFLVLRHQRTRDALPEQARAARVRYGTSSFVLDSACGMADPVGSVPSTGLTRGTSSSQPNTQRHGSPAALKFVIRIVGARHSRLLQFLDPTGVLHDPSPSRNCPARRRLAPARRIQ